MRHKSHRRNNPFASIFDNIFDVSISDALGADFISTHPPANVINDESEYIIKLFAPGLDKSNFDISIEEDQLKITVSLKEDKDDSAPKYTRREFSYKSFTRSFALDQTIDVDHIEATYQDGVLSIHLAKKEEAKEKGPLVIEVK